MPTGPRLRADFDGVWKETLRKYLRECLELYFPAIAGDVDWSEKPVFLDKELARIVRSARLGQLRADILARVRRRDGGLSVVNLHAEVQSQPDRELNARMFRYWSRFSDALEEPVASVAILGYPEPGPPAGRHERGLWGCANTFVFPVCRLHDPPGGGRAILEASPSPAAIVALAHVRAMETRGDMDLRAEEKFALVRRLHESGLSRQDVRELYHLMDWLLKLPEQKELTFQRRVVEYEETIKPMTHITAFERFGMRRGEQIGEQRGEQRGQRIGQQIGEQRGLSESICRLARRLGHLRLPEEEEAVRELAVERLRELTDRLLDFRDREEFLAWVAGDGQQVGRC